MTLLLVTLFVPPAAGLDPTTDVADYAVHLWQVSSGLPQNNVKALLQARDGHIWIGTKGGLARFDGVRFRVFDDLQSGPLPEIEVWALAEEADGTLWIGTFGGGVVRLQAGAFTTYTVRDGLASGFVTALASAPDGAVWVGTETAGISRIRAGRIESFGVDQGLLNESVRALCVDGSGTVWIGTGKGLSAYRGGGFENHPLAMAGDGRVVSIVEAREGGLWVATSIDGLFRFDAGVFTRPDLPGDPIPRTTSSLRLDSHGALWVGSSRGVCRVQDGRTSCMDPAAAGSTPVARSAAVEQVQAFLEDGEGNLWIGTASHGLAGLKDTQFLNYGPRHGLEDERSRAVIDGRDGSTWVGTFTGVARFRNGRFTNYVPPGGMSVHALFEDPAGALWIGSAQGLSVLENGRLRAVPIPGLQGAAVTGVLRDRRGDVWATTNGRGLVRIAGGTPRIYTVRDGLPGLTLRGLLEDAGGDIWFGVREAGLCRYASGRFTTLTAADGLAGNSVQALHRGPDGAVWVSTRRGLNRIDDSGRIRTLTAENGLPVNLIYQLIEDAGGDLWFTCGRGIFRMPRASLAGWLSGQSHHVECVPYGRETGLRAGSLPAGTQPTACRTRDGRLWFASLKGLSVLDPARERQRTFTPAVRIERVEIDGRVVENDAPARFGAGRGDLVMDYTALHFFSPDRVTFRYRLEGIDPEWVDAGVARSARYTRLPPGRHRFVVTARVGDGEWLEPAARDFDLAPHLYETKTFRVLSGLAVVLLLAWAYRLRIARMIDAETKLQARVDEAVASVRTLSGLLPICSWCHKVREDGGYWGQLEAYVTARSAAEFRHAICPDCLRRVSGE